LPMGGYRFRISLCYNPLHPTHPMEVLDVLAIRLDSGCIADRLPDR
jgi:hypothetical protein